MPSPIRPKLSAHGGVGNHEADSIRDLIGTNEPLELREGQDVLLDVFFAHGAHHRSVREARMDHTATDAIVDRFLLKRRGGALEAALGGGVSNLPLVSLR